MFHKVIIFTLVNLMICQATMANERNYLMLYHANQWQQAYQNIDKVISESKKDKTYFSKLAKKLIPNKTLQSTIIQHIDNYQIVRNENTIKIINTKNNKTIAMTLTSPLSGSFKLNGKTWHPDKYKSLPEFINEIEKGLHKKRSLTQKVSGLLMNEANAFVEILAIFAFLIALMSLLTGLPFILADASRPSYGFKTLDENLDKQLLQCREEIKQMDGNYAVYESSIAAKLLAGNEYIKNKSTFWSYKMDLKIDAFNNPTECQKLLFKEFSDDGDLLIEAKKIVNFCNKFKKLFKCAEDTKTKYNQASFINDQNRNIPKESQIIFTEKDISESAKQ